MAAPVLVCVHGRGQEFKDPGELLTKWLAGLNAGLTRVGRPTLSAERVVFPFFGNELYQVTAGLAGQQVRLESLPRGEAGPLHPETPPDVGDLEQEMIRDMARARGIPDGDPPHPAPGAVREEGLRDRVLTWGASRKLLILLAKRSRVDQLIISTQVKDVAVYLTHGRDAIQKIVQNAIPKDVPLVLVSHSLGTVVARDLLHDDQLRGRTQLWITAGSPLGLEAVQKNLLDPGAQHPGVPWLTVYDQNDVVALGHPLRATWGDPLTDVEVENGADPHSISRYLEHPEVADPIGTSMSTP